MITTIELKQPIEKVKKIRQFKSRKLAVKKESKPKPAPKKRGRKPKYKEMKPKRPRGRPK